MTTAEIILHAIAKVALYAAPLALIVLAVGRELTKRERS